MAIVRDFVPRFPRIFAKFSVTVFVRTEAMLSQREVLVWSASDGLNPSEV